MGANLRLSLIDKLILQFDNLLQTNKSSHVPNDTSTYPAHAIDNLQALTPTEERAVISMLRINHAGEVCAQALYQGQALMARSIQQHNALLQAAVEENAHLNWCHTRLAELNGRTSLLNPIWYAGSFVIGAAAGTAGDRVSMGFLAETEYQVSAHLTRHLAKIPAHDQKTRAILQQMQADELHHATTAEKNGATKLPLAIKILMRGVAKIMTVTAARI